MFDLSVKVELLKMSGEKRRATQLRALMKFHRIAAVYSTLFIINSKNLDNFHK